MRLRPSLPSVLLIAIGLAPEAHAANAIVFAGLRPTEAEFGATSLPKLVEAQETRKIVERALAAVSGREVIGHDLLSTLLGRAYLVDMFECEGRPDCIARVLAQVAASGPERVLYAEYYAAGSALRVRARSISLDAGTILSSHEFSIDQRSSGDENAWREGLKPLFEPAEEPPAARSTGTVEIITNVTGFVCTVDAEPCRIDEQGRLELEPGEHVIELSKPGYDSSTRVVKVQAGKDLRVALAVEASPQAHTTLAEPRAEPRHPGTWQIPGTDTSINIGGYARLDLIYDIGRSTGDRLFYPVIPLEEGSQRRGAIRAHPRQSRLWFRTWTPTRYGELSTHLEIDFFGTDETDVFANALGIRLRHAYGRWGRFLAGQTWSTFVNTDVFAETVNFAPLPGTSELRPPQVRYEQPLGAGFSVWVSLEDPETVALSGGVLEAEGRDMAPDLAVAVRYAFPVGVASFSAVGRLLTVDDGLSILERAFGFGTNFAVTAEVFEGTLLGGQVTYGEGIGRYLLVGALGNLDAVLNGDAANNASLDPIRIVGGSAFIRQQFIEEIRANLAFGIERPFLVDAFRERSMIDPTANDLVWALAGNVIVTPISSLNFGLEYVFAVRRTQDALTHRANRIQLGIQLGF